MISPSWDSSHGGSGGGVLRLLCYDVLADGSLAWLFSEKAYQPVTGTEADIYTRLLD